MKRTEFGLLFRRALDDAIAAANQDKSTYSDNIELHLNGRHDLDIRDAVSRLFLGDDRYFKFIDVSVHPSRNGWFFVRASGHEPVPWSDTCNPGELGPFKVVTPA